MKALDDVSLSVEAGRFVAIIGTSGSGKSTLLNMLGRLDRPTGGTVKVDNFSWRTFGTRTSHRLPPPADRFHLSKLQLDPLPHRL